MIDAEWAARLSPEVDAKSNLPRPTRPLADMLDDLDQQISRGEGTGTATRTSDSAMGPPHPEAPFGLTREAHELRHQMVRDSMRRRKP